MQISKGQLSLAAEGLLPLTLLLFTIRPAQTLSIGLGSVLSHFRLDVAAPNSLYVKQFTQKISNTRTRFAQPRTIIEMPRAAELSAEDLSPLSQPFPSLR